MLMNSNDASDDAVENLESKITRNDILYEIEKMKNGDQIDLKEKGRIANLNLIFKHRYGSRSWSKLQGVEDLPLNFKVEKPKENTLLNLFKNKKKQREKTHINLDFPVHFMNNSTRMKLRRKNTVIDDKGFKYMMKKPRNRTDSIKGIEKDSKRVSIRLNRNSQRLLSNFDDESIPRGTSNPRSRRGSRNNDTIVQDVDNIGMDGLENSQRFSDSSRNKDESVDPERISEEAEKLEDHSKVSKFNMINVKTSKNENHLAKSSIFIQKTKEFHKKITFDNLPKREERETSFDPKKKASPVSNKFSLKVHQKEFSKKTKKGAVSMTNRLTRPQKQVLISPFQKKRKIPVSAMKIFRSDAYNHQRQGEMRISSSLRNFKNNGLKEDSQDLFTDNQDQLGQINLNEKSRIKNQGVTFQIDDNSKILNFEELNESYSPTAKNQDIASLRSSLGRSNTLFRLKGSFNKLDNLIGSSRGIKSHMKGNIQPNKIGSRESPLKYKLHSHRIGVISNCEKLYKDDIAKYESFLKSNTIFKIVYHSNNTSSLIGDLIEPNKG